MIPLLLGGVLACASLATGTTPKRQPRVTADEQRLNISNQRTRLSFDRKTGALLSLENLRLPEEWQNYLPPSAAPPGPEPVNASAVCCAQSSVVPGAPPFFLKTGGHNSSCDGWHGAPRDRCCRVDGNDCRWFRSLAACQLTLADWQTTCESCTTSPSPIGCPTWASGGGSAAGGLTADFGLFRAWKNAPDPPAAQHASFAGQSPSPAEALPGGLLFVDKAISPSQCQLTNYTVTRGTKSGNWTLSMTSAHLESQLVFHQSIALAADDDSAVLSLRVESLGSHTANISVAFPCERGPAKPTPRNHDFGTNPRPPSLGTPAHS